MSETPAYIMDFLKAVYPESTELSVAFNNEKSCLIDATQRISNLEQQITDLKRELAEANSLIKRLRRNFIGC